MKKTKLYLASSVLILGLAITAFYFSSVLPALGVGTTNPTPQVSLTEDNTFSGDVTLASTTITGTTTFSGGIVGSEIAFFGEGADGVVTTSGDVTLTRDMFYSDLTISTGDIIYTNGFRVFASETLKVEGTGKFLSQGGNGGNGGIETTSGVCQGTGGAAGVADYSTGTLPIPINGLLGAGGSYSAANQDGCVGIAGTSITKGLSTTTGAVGGSGADSDSTTNTKIGGAGGTESGVKMSGVTSSITAVYNLYDIDTALTRYSVAPASGSGGGGATPNSAGGSGEGGGSGASGGVIWVAARTIESINAESIGGNGGISGASGAANGGVGGGGAGGNGGVIILIYNDASNITTDVSGGTGGAVSTGIGIKTGATAGSNGNNGAVYTLDLK